MLIFTHCYYLRVPDSGTLQNFIIDIAVEPRSSISNIVKHPYNHAYDTLLIIDFKPLSCCLFLDGRHRYIEYTKFNPNSAIPFYLLNDELCMTAILTKSELVTYIILHNISVINNFIMGKSDLSSIINLSRCLEPNYPK